MSSTIHVSRKAGTAPGSLIHIGSRHSKKVNSTQFVYDEVSFTEKSVDIKNDIIEPIINKNLWLNIDGLHDIKAIEHIGKAFNIHALFLEDILNTTQRPKVDVFGTSMLFTLKMLGIDSTGTSIVQEQVSFILGENYLISFQERTGDLFEPIRQRIRLSQGRVRSKNCDYLMFCLIDAIIDNYYLVIEHLSNQMEKLEEDVLKHNEDNILNHILEIKKALISLRRSVYPVREALLKTMKSESDVLINVDTLKYFRDAYDSTIHVIESVESQRDLLSGIKDLHSSEVSNKMNNIMKVLTIVSTIFIPITFLAGIYGMNFEKMPELTWRWSYPIFWLLIVAISSSMIFFFKKKKWL